jgi:DNA mismatch endonuclease (patch repair protein)
MSAWQVARPDPRQYKVPAGWTRAQSAGEQDVAAGGRDRRQIVRADGRVVAASVALRLPAKSRRVYAYLRWTGQNRVTIERYLGDVSQAGNREAALRMAWSKANGERDLAASSASQAPGETA